MDAFVEMAGVGTALAPPDVVALDLSVRCPGGSVADALQSADTGMHAILGLARDGGLKPAEMQTTGASVYPQYDRDGSSISGYVAQQSLRLRIRDRDQVGRLITAFSAAVGNALTIDNIALQIEETAPLVTEARRAAFADAETKARQFAALAGRALGQVLYVVDTPSGGGPVPVGGLARSKMAMDSYAGSMPVEMGENSVSAQVVVRWAWN